jgi:hypothetical protein
MKFIFRILLGVACALIGIELMLRFFPVSTSTETGYYISPSIITYPAHHEFVIATGWDLSNAHRYRSNNYGFLTRKDFIFDQNAIALIGDSYVEANMLKEDDHLSFQLEKILRNRSVYALGGPGSSLLDYAERARFAHEKFGIRNFVFVIESGDVRQTLCGSANIHGPCLDSNTFAPRSEAQPQKIGLAKKFLRKSALAQYLISQLRLNPNDIVKRLFPTTSSENTKLPKKNLSPENVPPEAVDHVVSAYLSSLAQLEMDGWILIFDSDRKCLKSNQVSHPVRDRFIQLATQAGAKIIDTRKIFCDFFQKTGLSLAVSPTDQHWNRLAHALVANAVAEKFITN